MWKDKLLTGITAVLFIAGVGSISWVLFSTYYFQEEIDEMGELSCVQEQKMFQMGDAYLAGLIEKGDTLKSFIGYYNCNPVQMGDLVYFRISPPIAPVVRIVYGLPGDQFELIRGSSADQWNIKINGDLIMSGEQPYFINSRHTPPLRTYQLARNGKLKNGEYIILSNIPPGISDSSNLGLIKKSALEGRVFIP